MRVESNKPKSVRAQAAVPGKVEALALRAHGLAARVHPPVFTVQRERDGLEAVVAWQNLGEVLRERTGA